MSSRMLTVAENFWGKVDRKNAGLNGCWIWIGARSYSYGNFTTGGKTWKAHRYAYALMVGDIPAGMVLMHTCDNHLCVNPAHLVPGTQAQNMREKLERNRGGKTGGVLTLQEARGIKALLKIGFTTKRLAELFKVSTRTIQHISHGKTWSKKK